MSSISSWYEGDWPAGISTCGFSATDSRVHLVEEGLLVVQVEVLRQVARRLVTRGAVERHVQRDQARALGAADRAAAAAGALRRRLVGHGGRGRPPPRGGGPPRPPPAPPPAPRAPPRP